MPKPQSEVDWHKFAIPKKAPIRLRGKKRSELRKIAYLKAQGICAGCGRFVPLYDCEGNFDLYLCGHMSHKIGIGAGGEDTLEGVEWKCYQCHIVKEHGLRWSKNDKNSRDAAR